LCTSYLGSPVTCGVHWGLVVQHLCALRVSLRPELVIFLLLVLTTGCISLEDDGGAVALTPFGRITDPALSESSGLVQSTRFDDVLWTHNDDGPPLLFAIRANGEVIRTYRLEQLTNHDWEDIAAYEGKLYLYDNLSRFDGSNRGIIHILREPDPLREVSAEILSSIEINLPLSGEDIETILIRDGSVYLVSKPWDSSRPRVYGLDKLENGTFAHRLAELPVLAMITSGDISKDGRRIAILSYRAVFIFEGRGPVEQILRSEPLICPLNAGQAEGVTWRGNDLLISTEQGNIFLVPSSSWKHRQAPFLRCPIIELPFIPTRPKIQRPLEDWPAGAWLYSQNLDNSRYNGRVAWNDSGLYIGIELDPEIDIAPLDRFRRFDFDNWFDPGRIYLAFNPSGTRPMSFGPDDRCIVIGKKDDGTISALAMVLRPATYIEKSEELPDWITVRRSGARFLVSFTAETPGILPLRENREYGFNLLITGSSGQIFSWAPLTTQFPWDAPSIWGLVTLTR